MGVLYTFCFNFPVNLKLLCNIKSSKKKKKTRRSPLQCVLMCKHLACYKQVGDRGERALPGLFWQLYVNETFGYILKMHLFLFSNIGSLYACLIYQDFF